jgi:hypothetical protein
MQFYATVRPDLGADGSEIPADVIIADRWWAKSAAREIIWWTYSTATSGVSKRVYSSALIGLSGMTVQPWALAAERSSSVGGIVWPRAAARAVIAAMTASKMSCDRRIACSWAVQLSGAQLQAGDDPLHMSVERTQAVVSLVLYCNSSRHSGLQIWP